MDILEASRIVHALADGVDPYTGEIFPPDSPYQNPQTVRALFAALTALDSVRKEDKPKRRLPDNAGNKWEEKEEEELGRQFEAGTPVKVIARLHGRTEGAIETRLVRMGKITNRYLIATIGQRVEQQK